MAIKLRSDDALQSALLRFGDTAFRICYMHTKSPKAARELLEEVFLQYCLYRKEFKNEDDERFWVLRTAHKACMDYYSAKLRKNPSDDQIQQAGRSLDFVISDELCKIMKLPYTYLTALALCYGEGESPAFAAKVTGRRAASLSDYLRKTLEKTALSEEDMREWIQTIYMPDDMRSRVQYNILTTIQDKHFSVNSRAKTLKRAVDRAIPYVALGLICFGVFTVVALRSGWFGVEYVRTPMAEDTVVSDTGTAASDSAGEASAGETSAASSQEGGAATLSLAYFVPDGDSLIRHNCTMEADASVLIAKMAENGAFSAETQLLDIRFLKNKKNVTTLKSGEMPDVQLYFTAELQDELDSGDGMAILEAISRTILNFYKTGNITPAKLEIFANGRPVTVNGEEVDCTLLLYGGMPVSATVED